MASPTSSDEGEIVETGVGAGDLKATSLPQIHGTGVDRPDRNRGKYSRSRSPEYDAGSKHSQTSSRRSNSPRGFKRSRNDRDILPGGRSSGDPRQFRVHYETVRDSRRSQYSYDDDDGPPSRLSTSGLRYDDKDRSRDYDRSDNHSRDRDRDGYPDKRARNRTRSPYRPPRNGRDRNDRDRRDGSDRQKRASDWSRDMLEKNGRSSHARYETAQQVNSAERNGTFRNDATKSTKMSSTEAGVATGSAHTSAPTEEAEEEEEPLDEATEIERRRRRREELLAKTRGPTPMLVQALQGAALHSPAHTQQSTPLATEASTPGSGM